MEHLKCEVHYLEQKLKDLGRVGRELMGELEGSVYRRESMFERLTVQASLKVLQFQVFQMFFCSLSFHPMYVPALRLRKFTILKAFGP